MPSSEGPQIVGRELSEAAIHRLKNQMTIILGFSAALLEDLAADDPKRDDVIEIQKAAETATRVLRGGA